MARERLATQELQGVLELLTEVENASARPIQAALEPRVPKLRPKAAPPNKLFLPVKVEGEDQLSRSSGEEKIAVLRRKVRALEERFEDIKEGWTKLEGQLDQARDATQREKEQREAAEEGVHKLNTFIGHKKKEIEAYHARVQEALLVQARREQELQERSEQREQELVERAERREYELQARAERRQAELQERAERREEQLRERATKRAEELQEQAERRTQALQARSEKREQDLAERAVQAESALEQQKSTPPPPPLLTESDIVELAQCVVTAGRNLTRIVKGKLRSEEAADALNEALQSLRVGNELLSSVLRDMRDS